MSYSNGKKNVLLCVSSSVAAIKIPELVIKLYKSYNIFIVFSSIHALDFLIKAKDYNPQYYSMFEAIGGFDLIVTDQEEWSLWNKIGDVVLHIELRKWADLILIGKSFI